MENDELKSVFAQDGFFEIEEDEDGLHSKYETIVYQSKYLPNGCGGDFIKFGCKSLEEAIESIKGLSISKALFGVPL